jgi:hypothetical protein
MWPFKRREPATPTDRFKLVQIDHPTRAGWYAYQAYREVDGDTTWVRLGYWGCDAPTRENAEARIAEARARLRHNEPETIVQEIEV